MVSGVAQVSVYGSQKYAVRVQLDPRALTAKGLGMDEVSQAIKSANVNQPLGTLYGPNRAYTLADNGQLENAAGYMNLIVAYRDGRPVRLQELGSVLDSVENNKSAAWYVDPQNIQRSIILAVQKQPGSNTVQVAKDVRALVETLQGQIPAAVSLHILYDRSESIQDSVRDVKVTLLLTLVLVVLVIFLFLRNFSATDHSQPGPAHVHHRHVCRHASAELQSGQPLPHGPDPMRRVCGG